MIVDTAHGKLAGSREGDVVRFLGVPYGGPTGGPNRFRPPPPVEPWVGVRDATALGPISPQLVNGGRDRGVEVQALFGGGDSRGAIQSEDCLRLNIWTPGLDGARRPVMVWLHGGAYLYGMGTGPGPDAMTDGAALASAGDVVVVTVNHRVGIVGHLSLAELFGPDYASSGNAGLLDIAAALEWVRDSIAAFGGDPGRVLVFGQSGGGSKAHALMAMPRAEGLFHAAALQSGFARTFHTPASATAIAERLVADIGARTPDDLMAAPLARLLEAQAAELERDPTVVGLQPFYPVVDGGSMPVHPVDAMNEGWASAVPMVVGTVKDEVDLFLAVDESMDDDDLLGFLRGQTSDRRPSILDTYRARYPTLTAADLYRRVETDRLFRLPSIELASRRSRAAAPVWMYEFVHDAGAMPGGRGGAPHAIDIPYLFRTVDRVRLTGDSDDRYPLSDRMSRAWVAFARHGDPNHPDLPSWPAYRPDDRATMMFDTRCWVAYDPGGEARRAWA